MNYSCSGVEAIIWNMRLSDLPRSSMRAQIDRLANGQPPLTEAERVAQNAHCNTNFLDLPKLLADARRTCDGAHLKPGVFFNVTVEHGDPNKSPQYGRSITRRINKIMKDSLAYFELRRSTSAMVIEHGIGPAHWQDGNRWCPKSTAIADVLIPSNTLLTMENLPYFAIFHQYTPLELYKLTRGKKHKKNGKVIVDPAWKMPMVDAAIKWALSQDVGTKNLQGTTVFSPEKWEDAIKENPGYYGSDAVPTIDCWRFFFWSDENGVEGWRQKIVLDTPPPSQIDKDETPAMPNKNGIGEDHGKWLYNPPDSRVYASKLGEIIHFQFGDASAVAPFKYHTVRSLGWLLYSVCHLQNRLRNKVNDATFESLQQYFRVTNQDDQERVTKIDLHNFGVIPDGVNPVPANERFQINENLVQLTTGENRNSMNEAAAQFREGRDQGAQQTAKTATQVMAEVNAANALVGGMILQSYTYAKFQYQEICRRFCNPKSTDPDVMRFRVNVLKDGVPVKCLNSSLWNVEPERVMGSGNKILEVAMADKLMAARPLHDPESQRKILHIYDLANCDDPAMADILVPPTPAIGNSVQLAKNMVGSLMQGIPMEPVSGLNPIEVIETLLPAMATVLKQLQSGQPTARDIAGAANIGQTIGLWIQQLSQDKTEGDRVTKYGKDLATLNRSVDEISAQVQPNANSGVDPVSAAKVQAIAATTQAKIQSGQAASTQKLQQKGEAFAQKQGQVQEKHRTTLQERLDAAAVNRATADLGTAAEIKRKDLAAKAKPETGGFNP